MSFLMKLIGRKQKEKFKVLIVGPSGSGKTTAREYFRTGQPVENHLVSTVGTGYTHKPLDIGNWSFEIVEVGGQKEYIESYGVNLISKYRGIVYLVDSTISPSDQEKYENAIWTFKKLSEGFRKWIPIVIFYNKKDLPESLSKNDLQKYYLESFKDDFMLREVTHYYFETSAKKGDGLKDAMTWLFNEMERLYDQFEN